MVNVPARLSYSMLSRHRMLLTSLKFRPTIGAHSLIEQRGLFIMSTPTWRVPENIST